MHLVDISLQSRDSDLLLSVPNVDLPKPPNKPNSPPSSPSMGVKSCIVDSGTTDTYFSQTIANDFKAIFKRLSGIVYTNDNIALTNEALKKLPNIVLTFQSAATSAAGGATSEDPSEGPSRATSEKATSSPGATSPAAGGASTFQLLMPWTSYVDSVGDGKYAFRIYLNEPGGFLLGANFMNGYNIIFDADGGRYEYTAYSVYSV